MRDAVLLYRDGRFAGGCVLGAVSLEHLGQYHWLRDQWRQGLSIECEELKGKLKRDHQQKLREGLMSLQFSAPSSVDELFRRAEQMRPDDPRYAELARQHYEATQRLINRAPGKFHDLRTRAQYVEPRGGCRGWDSPQSVGQAEAHDLLLNVGNNYRGIFVWDWFREKEVSEAIERMGFEDTLWDLRDTWPPPEGDAFG